MHKPSFVTGLVAGGVFALGAVIAVPAFVPLDEEEPRAVRTPDPVVVRVPERPPPAEHTRVKLPVHPPRDHTQQDEQKKKPTPVERIKAQRSRSNEWAAIATLRNIASAQAQFQSTARADENMNGIGEYGSFAELSGAVGVREGAKLNPPVLSSAFKIVKQGRVKRSGYYYRIYLVRPNGRAISENDDGGFLAREVDPNYSERTWCCYAWPVDRGVTGERTFFVNQEGDVLANKDQKYGGEEEPTADAAFEPGGRGIRGTAAAEGTGADGGHWEQAG